MSWKKPKLSTELRGTTELDNNSLWVHHISKPSHYMLSLVPKKCHCAVLTSLQCFQNKSTTLFWFINTDILKCVIIIISVEGDRILRDTKHYTHYKLHKRVVMWWTWVVFALPVCCRWLLCCLVVKRITHASGVLTLYPLSLSGHGA